MGLDELKQKATTWLLSIAIKKAIPKVVMAVTAVIGAKYLPLLESYGVKVDLNALQTALVGLLVGGLDMVRNYLKVKTGIVWL